MPVFRPNLLRIVGSAIALGGIAVGYASWSQSSPSPNEIPAPPTSTQTKMTGGNSALAAPQSERSPSESPEEIDLPQEPVPPEELSPAQIEQIVLGDWQSSYYGTRYLTVRGDGTATIRYRASTMAMMFVGSRLTIEYDWEYLPDEQMVVFTTTGGHPQKGMDYVKKMWGDTQRQTVASAGVQELNLTDLDGETKHVWKKLPEIPADIIKEFSK